MRKAITILIPVLLLAFLASYYFDSRNTAEPKKLTVKTESASPAAKEPVHKETVSAAVKTTSKQNQPSPKRNEIESLPAKQQTKSPVILNVPLLRQMDSPRLYNGCEVTSLAMLLNFYGLHVTKNELAGKIDIVPLHYQNGDYGNPNAGFVGNMQNGPGLGVYHGPILKLAQKYVGTKAHDLTNQSFASVLKQLDHGYPVWVITTSSFAPVSQFKTWNTPQGPVKVTFSMHSVVITGYDNDHLYINNPYGTKNQKVDRERFQDAWEQMGRQAIVIQGRLNR